MEFRNRIIDEYAVVFNGTESGNQEVKLDGDFASRWGWFGVMYRLTNGNIKDLEKITKIELLECLTWLSYETDLQISQNVTRDGTK